MLCSGVTVGIRMETRRATFFETARQRLRKVKFHVRTTSHKLIFSKKEKRLKQASLTMLLVGFNVKELLSGQSDRIFKDHNDGKERKASTVHFEDDIQANRFR